MAGASSQTAKVLLIGAGTGEATCGILYLASYLRRGGIEAYVRLTDFDGTQQEMADSIERLISRLKPTIVGISLKWFHHVARALQLAQLLRTLDPRIRIVFGGNTASYFWKELAGWDCVDDIILGDGEVPLLSLCRGDAAPPNVVRRGHEGQPGRSPLEYVQGTTTTDVYYSHFKDIFLSQEDLYSFSGWVAPGRGCGENCLYCGGARGIQKASFGRAKPFLRPEENVQRDHREAAPHTWQFRYDFAGSTADFLERSWAGVDLSRHSTTYFLWGVPPPELVTALAKNFQRVFMVLDIGCFSEIQRQEQMKRGLLKPCPTDRELMAVIEASLRHPNLELEISGIAGLPFASERTLAQERVLVEQLLALRCTVGYQRLEAQPGALVTEHPARFEMKTEARTFQEFLDYFTSAPEIGTVPMVRFVDPKLEAAVQGTTEDLQAQIDEQSAAAQRFAFTGRSKLVNASASTSEVALGDWLGSHRVPPRVSKERVTVVRSTIGTGLACLPSLNTRQFYDAGLQQGADGAAILAVLAAFERPTAVDEVISRLRSKLKLQAEEVHGLIESLGAGRFLRLHQPTLCHT